MVQHSSFNVWEGGTEKELKILFFLTAQKNDAVGNAHRDTKQRAFSKKKCNSPRLASNLCVYNT